MICACDAAAHATRCTPNTTMRSILILLIFAGQVLYVLGPALVVLFVVFLIVWPRAAAPGKAPGKPPQQAPAPPPRYLCGCKRVRGQDPWWMEGRDAPTPLSDWEQQAENEAESAHSEWGISRDLARWRYAQRHPPPWA